MPAVMTALTIGCLWGEHMLVSMTGFGQASRQIDGVVYSVELRTVNNRYYKSSLRLPDGIGFLEDDIDKLLREQINRGSVTFILRHKNVSADLMFDIDEHVLQSYIDKLSAVSFKGDSKLNRHVNLADMLLLPGVMNPVVPGDELAEQIRRAVRTVTQEAVDKLNTMRLDEGKALEADLRANCRAILERIDKISQAAPRVVVEYQQKLKTRVEHLLSEARLELDNALLAREVAVFAERCDISEEIIRLRSHVQQFVAVCDSKNGEGRKLDFIAQEMLREANTIASKCSDGLIAQNVVDIKTFVDRIKEQVQNVE